MLEGVRLSEWFGLWCRSVEIVMSIASSIYSEYADGKRKEWLAKLEAARAAEDWAMVDALIAEMTRFYFSE